MCVNYVKSNSRKGVICGNIFVSMKSKIILVEVVIWDLLNKMNWEHISNYTLMVIRSQKQARQNWQRSKMPNLKFKKNSHMVSILVTFTVSFHLWPYCVISSFVLSELCIHLYIQNMLKSVCTYACSADIIMLWDFINSNNLVGFSTQKSKWSDIVCEYVCSEFWLVKILLFTVICFTGWLI